MELQSANHHILIASVFVNDKFHFRVQTESWLIRLIYLKCNSRIMSMEGLNYVFEHCTCNPFPLKLSSSEKVWNVDLLGVLILVECNHSSKGIIHKTKVEISMRCQLLTILMQIYNC